MPNWTAALMVALVLGGAGSVRAQTATSGGAEDRARVLVDGEIAIVTKSRAPAHLDGHLENVLSDFIQQSDTARAMQETDATNPGITASERAKPLWVAVDGRAGKACVDCHGPVEGMAGVAAEFPKWNDTAQALFTLQMQVNDCRAARMKADPWPLDSAAALEVEALLARLSRGAPVNVSIDGPARVAWERGRGLYYSPTGPDQKSCATCHEARANDENDDTDAGTDPGTPPGQGHVNGFPAYRLSRAAMEGVSTRFQICLRRLDPAAAVPDAAARAALELYVASRGNGLSVEGPSVRD